MEWKKTRTSKRRCDGIELEHLHEKKNLKGKEENFESRRNDKLSNEWLKVRKTIFPSKVILVLDFVRSVSVLR